MKRFARIDGFLAAQVEYHQIAVHLGAALELILELLFVAESTSPHVL